MKNLKELKNYILNNIKNDWTELEKTRYVYIISGKYLQKHTEFFLSLDNKLKETKLSIKKMDNIYLGRLKKEEWNKMVCKTGAEFIKDVLDELNIKSHLVETVKYIKVKGMRNHLHHYTLCVNVDENNIFITPTSDYPYIKMGMATKHFGIDVPYIVDGEIFYKGNEIDHIILTKKELKEIDDKLGLTEKYYDDSKKDEIKNVYTDELLKKDKNLYINFLAQNTDFYLGIIPIDEDKRKIKFITDDHNNWNELINYICFNVGKKISELTNNEYDLNEYIDINNFNLWDDYTRYLLLNEKKDIKDIFYSNPVLLKNKAKALCELIISFKLKNKFEMEPSDIIKFRNTFNRLLLEVSKHFIDPKFVIEPKDKNNYVSNAYINHKFSTLFPYLMNANTGFKEKINREGFSEQSEIIKRLIEIMFQDLNSNNLYKENIVGFKYSPIFKRINIYTIRKNNTNNYMLLFAITDSDTNSVSSSYWYKYDIKDNIFEKTSFAKVISESSRRGKYEILSNRLKNALENLENQESYNLKLKKNK